MDPNTLFVIGVILIVLSLLVMFFRHTRHRDIEDTMGWNDDNPDDG